MRRAPKTYGAVKEMPAKVNGAPFRPGPEMRRKLAEAVLRIVETPAGGEEVAVFR